MILKTVGAILVLTSATAIGSILAFRVKEQERWLADMKLSLVLLSGELEYHQVPFPEAMRLTGNKHKGRLQEFFRRTGEELEKREGESLSVVWSRQAENCLKAAPLKREQKEAFSEIGIYFAGADSKVRKNALEFYFSRLEEEIVRMRNTEKEKVYLYRMLGMLGGVFLLILAC